MKAKTKRMLGLSWIILATLAGSAMIILLFLDFTRDIMAEYDEQIFHLAYAVDNTFVHEMNECMDQLANMIGDPEHRAAEEAFVRDGEVEDLREAFSQSYLAVDDSVAGILMQYEDRLLVLEEKLEGGVFTMLPDEDGDLLFFCKDELEHYYPALLVESQTPGIRYYILLDFASFYKDVVPQVLTEENWIVFYDLESGFASQNHANQPSYLVMSQDEIRKRNDGYTIIMENEIRNQSGAVTYEYANYSGKLVEERLITLPSCETRNGVCAIGISRDSEKLYASLRIRTIEIIGLIIMIIFLGIMLSYGYNRKYYEGLRAQEEIEHLEREKVLSRQLTEIQLQAAVSQMQPHFIFNAMSSIRELILENPEHAADMLYEFTRYLRACINAMGSSELIPFTEEWKNIEAYVRIEQMRMGDRLQVVWDIEDTDFSIIPLSVQPLVENAIRHGICKRRGRRGTVSVISRYEAGCHRIIVADDGIGFDVAEVAREIEEGKRDSSALKNIRFRLEQSMNAKLSVESEVGCGTKVTITIADQGPRDSSGQETI